MVYTMHKPYFLYISHFRTYSVARQQLGNIATSIVWKECDPSGNDKSKVLDKSQLSFQQLGKYGEKSLKENKT